MTRTIKILELSYNKKPNAVKELVFGALRERAQKALEQEKRRVGKNYLFESRKVRRIEFKDKENRDAFLKELKKYVSFSTQTGRITGQKLPAIEITGLKQVTIDYDLLNKAIVFADKGNIFDLVNKYGVKAYDPVGGHKEVPLGEAEIKYTKQGKSEVDDYNLASNNSYQKHLQQYIAQYEKRPPSSDVGNKNMLKALRMGPWNNSAEDWARLHATEYFLKLRKESLDESQDWKDFMKKTKYPDMKLKDAVKKDPKYFQAIMKAYYMPSDLKKEIEQYLNESLNEDAIGDIASIIGGKSLMDLRKPLSDKFGAKNVDYVNSPYPAFMVKTGGKTVAILNKKYADDPDKVVGDLAIGYL